MIFFLLKLLAGIIAVFLLLLIGVALACYAECDQPTTVHVSRKPSEPELQAWEKVKERQRKREERFAQNSKMIKDIYAPLHKEIEEHSKALDKAIEKVQRFAAEQKARGEAFDRDASRVNTNFALVLTRMVGIANLLIDGIDSGDFPRRQDSTQPRTRCSYRYGGRRSITSDRRDTGYDLQ